MNHSYKTRKNHMLCFKNLGIMNNETLRKAQQNTRMNELRSIQGMQDMAFLRVQFSKTFPGEHAPRPPYISNSCIWG